MEAEAIFEHPIRKRKEKKRGEEKTLRSLAGKTEILSWSPLVFLLVALPWALLALISKKKEFRRSSSRKVFFEQNNILPPSRFRHLGP